MLQENSSQNSLIKYFNQMIKLNYFRCFLLLILSLSHLSLQAQNDSISKTRLISFYLTKKQIKQADSVLKNQLDYLKSENLNDSLHKYIYYVGKIELLKSNAKIASKKAEDFLTYITLNTENKKTHYQALINLADFYDEIGENQKSLNVTKTSLEIIYEVDNATPEEIGKIEYNLGATFLSLDHLDEAKQYFKNALTNFESYSLTSKAQLSDAYNAVGATMWMSSKLDSAKYYYSKASKTIENAKGEPLLNLYLGTIIKSNISLLEYTQGNLTEAINIQNEVILNYEKTIKNYTDESIVSKAKKYQNRAISNMAVFYNEQGHLEKAHNLLLFSYEKQKESHEFIDSDLAATLIQLGQSKISLKEYDKALDFLEKGVNLFKYKNIKNLYWQAAGLHAMAEVYTAKQNIALAKTYYIQSELLFKESLGNVYDTEFLNFLRNKSIFMAQNDEPEIALKIAFDAYNYVLKNAEENNFSLFKQTLNLAKVNYKIGHYEKSLEWIENANQYLNKSSATIDLKQIDFNKPQLILLKSLADYKLKRNRDAAFLEQQLSNLQLAISILEERKTTIYKNEDILLLMSDYQEISNFSKKLTLELYNKTKDVKNINKIIELHESSIYNRIRSRLNLKNNISFTDVPLHILEREKTLKNAMATSLNTSKNIQTFFSSNKNWTIFLDSLKTHCPKYYKMRYASIEEPLHNINKQIDDKTTVVRYLYINENLHAVVISNKNKNIFELNNENISNYIAQLAKNQSNFDSTSLRLHQLYKQLWKPLENEVNTENVIIIPDEELFNLSFETLTPKKINSFKELADHSLLAKHIISYNYSLLLIGNERKAIEYENDFIAFAPEFNDKMKIDYRIKTTDSLSIDKTYLSLLPQPFSVDLAKEYSQVFNGSYFINQNASKKIFTNKANEHKIIHIGTHAESNNVTPELSRLIFAKNTENEDNSLYTFEIYNESLNSNLAILTACDTGKPTYQAGEGMISLAHAFNYAGSESILTSLWKIDEQSSNKIIELFYNHIKKGVPKDKALKQAKLDYLSNIEDRTIAPHYWAGLVLIGDTTPIDLNTSYNLLWNLLSALIIIIIAVFIIKIRRIK